MKEQKTAKAGGEVKDQVHGLPRPKRVSRVVNVILVHIYLIDYEYIVHKTERRITYEITKLGYCTTEPCI